MAHWTKILGDATVVKKTILFEGREAGNFVSWEQSGEREIGYWVGKSHWGREPQIGVYSRQTTVLRSPNRS